MTAIRAERLSRSFGDVTAVVNLTLSVEEGELFGLVGPDGAGKTTTMRLLAAILEPTGGDAWVGGHHTVREPEQVKEQIAYVGQRFGLYPDLTVEENIHFYADLYGVPQPERPARMERLLAFSNLAPFTGRLAGNLSGGMKQKLSLACALVHTPRILLLDEPTSGVDPLSRHELWRILYELIREKVTIFVSTAYLDEAERFHRVALLHQGQLLACGTPRELKGLLQGSIVELRPDQPRAAAALLREHFSPAAVNVFGNRIHLLTADPDGDIPRVGQAMAQRGLALAPPRRIEPNLEDVFLSLVMRSGFGANQAVAGQP
jgi:ABC-2 type transport system ATP-binding protein